MIRFVFWDVQHGHSTYLRTATEHIVFDLGVGSYSSSEQFSPLMHLKDKYRVERLDAVIITHPHGDHLYDIHNFDLLYPRVLYRPKHLTEQEVREGNSSADKSFVDKYYKIDKRYSGDVAVDPFSPQTNGGVEIKYFIPHESSTLNLNNHSIVTVVSHANSKIIIPGDNENPSWNELLKNNTFVNTIAGTDILLAPHHGRDAGYSEALFEHISPYLTIVSDGAETDTSATDRYSKKSKGWQVWRRNGEKQERKCVTTRNDGVIVVEFGINAQNQPYMSAKID